jgi:hypothetical protein
VSETESKHNNRSAFGDEITDPHAFARNHPIAPVFGIGVNSATSGDPLWSQTIHQCTARALTAALADALGIELHPAGTAARLSAERSQLLPPRRLRVPPVYRGLPPDVLECLYHTLCRRTYPAEVRNKAFDIMYERDLMDHYTGDLTDDGWGDLTAIEHPEGREHVETADAEAPADLTDTDIAALLYLRDRDGWARIAAHRCTHLVELGLAIVPFREHATFTPKGRRVADVFAARTQRAVVQPEPLPYTEAVIAELLWRPISTSARDAMDAGILRSDGKPTNEGLQVRAEVLRRLGIERGEEAAEPPAEPGPQWSEPIEQMSPERCYHVARALGFHVEVRSTFDGADRTYWAFISEWNGLDQDDGPRMATELEAWQSAVVMAARKRDRYDAETDRVGLTGLEVRS